MSLSGTYRLWTPKIAIDGIILASKPLLPFNDDKIWDEDGKSVETLILELRMRAYEDEGISASISIRFPKRGGDFRSDLCFEPFAPELVREIDAASPTSTKQQIKMLNITRREAIR